MYILDTNVVSELRKARKTHPNVRKWAARLPAASLYISVISVLELEIGIRLIDRRDKEQGAILRAAEIEFEPPRLRGNFHEPADLT